MLIHDILIKAIKERKTLAIKYDSDKEERFIEPYLYGVGSERRDLLRAYQFSGFTNTELDWKLFDASLIKKARFLDKSDGRRKKEFKTNRPRFKQNDSQILGKKYARVKNI